MIVYVDGTKAALVGNTLSMCKNYVKKTIVIEGVQYNIQKKYKSVFNSDVYNYLLEPL